jgi:hypothetical protein
MLSAMDVDDLQHALGAIVMEASYLERVLRGAFGGLVGSRYAPVVDGRMSAHELIEICQHVARVHADISEPQRAALRTALNACTSANHKRNRVIHDAWVFRPGGALMTLSPALPAPISSTTRTVPDLLKLAEQIGSAADGLANSIAAALGPDSMRLEDNLRPEPANDLDVDGSN